MSNTPPCPTENFCLSVSITRPNCAPWRQRYNNQLFSAMQRPQKTMASAPQHLHSLLTQLVPAPAIRSGKFLHGPQVIYSCVATKAGLKKRPSVGILHADTIPNWTIMNGQEAWNKARVFRHTCVSVPVCVFNIVYISSCVLWLS